MSPVPDGSLWTAPACCTPGGLQQKRGVLLVGPELFSLCLFIFVAGEIQCLLVILEKLLNVAGF